MMRNRFVLLALFFFPFLLRPQSAKPAWQIDLSNFGYQGRPPAALAHLGPEVLMRFGNGINQQGVAFTSPNVAVAYFVVHDDPPGAALPHEPALSDPFRLVAVFLNARNGELIKQLDWPLPANENCGPSAFFFPATQGRFVVALGNSLRLYSPDFKLLNHFEAQSDLYPMASPSGETLLLHLEKQVRRLLRFHSGRPARPRYLPLMGSHTIGVCMSRRALRAWKRQSRDVGESPA